MSIRGGTPRTEISHMVPFGSILELGTKGSAKDFLGKVGFKVGFEGIEREVAWPHICVWVGSSSHKGQL